jgi:hypothetical protein
MKITVAMLRKVHACPEGIALFRKTFGERVIVSMRNCASAQDAGLDLEWAAYHLLSAKQWKIWLAEINVAHNTFVKGILKGTTDKEAYRGAIAGAFYKAANNR